MLRKVSSTTLWVAIFLVIVAVQAVSMFAQSSDIHGSWKNGSFGMISYQNRTTGATKPGRGSIFTYKFNPNGTYEFVGYMEITMYNCTTTLFNSIAGRYKVNGSTISLNPSKDFWKNTNSCAASGNKQQNKVPTRLSISYERKQDEYGKELLCITAKEGETCYRKEE
ncbi:MAG: hypothetical protein ABL984_00745 [Pyrinomonadaceae bacterium]